MKDSVAIQIIHASDAEQHLGYLKKILDSFVRDHRIAMYASLENHLVNESRLKSVRDGDMVIILLTNGIVPDKGSIDTVLQNKKSHLPNIKIAEVIIDNIPYDPQFIAFPADLQPIRERSDMDAVWARIYQGLCSLFPILEEPVKEPFPWKKYIPFILGAIVLVLLFFVVRGFFGNGSGDPADFKVMDASTELLSNPHYSGVCPHKFEFEGKIVVNQAGKVEFTWINSDNDVVPVQTLIFKEGGSKLIHSTWEIKIEGRQYWQQLKIISPHEMVSNRTTFSVACH